MNLKIKNILAIVVGVVIGSVVNGAIIKVSGSIIPPPEGADFTTEAGIKASMHLMQPQHFVFPFLAHALGTFVGALLAALIAASNKMRFAIVIGFVFLTGGISMVLMLPSPIWFTVLDLVGAYIPMAYFGAKLVIKKD